MNLTFSRFLAILAVIVTTVKVSKQQSILRVDILSFELQINIT